MRGPSVAAAWREQIVGRLEPRGELCAEDPPTMLGRLSRLGGHSPVRKLRPTEGAGGVTDLTGKIPILGQMIWPQVTSGESRLIAARCITARSIKKDDGDGLASDSGRYWRVYPI